MGPNLVRVWGVPLFFPDFDISISFPVVALIFTAELCALFLALSCISFHDSDSFVIYSDFRSALQAFGNLYICNPLVLKIQRSLCDLHALRKFVSFCWIPSHVGLCDNEKLMFWPKGPPNYPQPIIMLYPFRTIFPLFAVPSVPPGSPLGPVCCGRQ